MVALNRRQPVVHADCRPMSRRGTFVSASVTAFCSTSAIAVCSTCSRIGRTNSSASCTIWFAIFASLMMSFSIDCASGESATAAWRFSSAGHDFDARERVLHFVRDGGRHLAERDEPIAQALALFELLDLRQVLEEQRDAGRAAALVAHVRQRVADDLAGRLQPQLGAVGQVAQLERAVQHAHHVGVLGEHFGEVAADACAATA